jgi:hypothetical protein
MSNIYYYSPILIIIYSFSIHNLLLLLYTKYYQIHNDLQEYDLYRKIDDLLSKI